MNAKIKQKRNPVERSTNHAATAGNGGAGPGTRDGSNDVFSDNGAGARVDTGGGEYLAGGGYGDSGAGGLDVGSNGISSPKAGGYG